MTEEWKQIPSAPNYEASSQGRIRRAMPGKRTYVGRVMKSQLIRGYWAVWLTHDAQQKRHLVSRLVCEAFHGPAPSDKPLAAHGDGNTNNNTPDNLRWADHFENGQDMLRHGTAMIGEKAPHAKLTAYDVVVIRAAFDGGVSAQILAGQFGVHYSNIHYIVKRQSWKHI